MNWRGGVEMRLISFALVLLLAVPSVSDELITLADFDEFSGESNPNGYCYGEVAPSPDGQGFVSIKVTYRILNKDVTDWIDFSFHPVPPRDVSGHDVIYLDIYPLQDADYLVLKLVDPDVTTNPNRSAFESSLLPISGGMLRAHTWNRCVVKLPKEKVFKDSLVEINFYIPCRSGVPKDKDVVFFIGKFKPQDLPQVEVKHLPMRLLASFDFEGDTTGLKLHRTTITQSEGEVISGKRSLKCDTREAPSEWNEFLHTDTKVIQLEPKKHYAITFNYKVLADGLYYCLVRCPDGIKFDIGWLQWKGVANEVGMKVVSFIVPERKGYYFILGIKDAGAIAIDDLRIYEVIH
jgi:hypothetical protein